MLKKYLKSIQRAHLEYFKVFQIEGAREIEELLIHYCYYYYQWKLHILICTILHIFITTHYCEYIHWGMLWRREIIEKLIKNPQYNKRYYNHKNVSAKQKQ